jgi:hypothetical protein
VTAAAPWVAAEIEPEHAIAELRRRFPWALTWWGRSTGRWWAMFRDRTGRDRLVEASDPVEMGRLLEHLGERIVPRFSRTTHQTGAAARSTPTPSTVSRAAAPSHAAEALYGRRRRPRGGWLRRLVAG